ncbi:MAG: hypothetical protein K0R03_2 [Moraxellaceae bacterium]|nr:hypothetical protein [Moraxellaceae bacterium]
MLLPVPVSATSLATMSAWSFSAAKVSLTVVMAPVVVLAKVSVKVPPVTFSSLSSCTSRTPALSLSRLVATLALDSPSLTSVASRKSLPV